MSQPKPNNTGMLSNMKYSLVAVSLAAFFAPFAVNLSPAFACAIYDVSCHAKRVGDDIGDTIREVPIPRRNDPPKPIPYDEYRRREAERLGLIIPDRGFYKQGNQPEVYLAYRSGFYCHVQNEDQMSAFGGFGKVQIVGSLNLNGTNTGDCGWPNGFFKRSNQPEVYRMYGGGIPEFNIGDSFCHVANEAQMNAYGGFGKVRVISPSSDSGRGRNFTGDC